MSVKKIRKNLEELGLLVTRTYKDILCSSKTPVATKAKICASILDRCGAPVIRANISKNTTERDWDSRDLAEVKEVLKLKEAELVKKIETIEEGV